MFIMPDQNIRGNVTIFQELQQQVGLLSTYDFDRYNSLYVSTSASLYAFEATMTYLYGLDRMIQKDPYVLTGNQTNPYNIPPIFKEFSNTSYPGILSEGVVYDDKANLETDWMVYIISSNTSSCLLNSSSCTTFLRYNHQNQTVSLVEPPIFYGGSTKIPPDRRMLSYITPSDSMKMFIITASTLGMLLSAIVIVLVISYSKNPAVRARGIPFLVASAIGCLLIFLSLISWLNNMSTLNCHLKLWSLLCGWNLINVPLIAREILVYRIYNQSSIFLKRTRIDLFKLPIAISIIFLIVEVLLLFLWSFFVNLRITTKIVDIFFIYPYCKTENSFAGSFTFTAFIVFHLGILLIMIIMGILNRNISNEHNQSTSIIVFSVAQTLLGIVALLDFNSITISTDGSEYLTTVQYIAAYGLLAVVWIFFPIVGLIVQKLSEKEQHSHPHKAQHKQQHHKSSKKFVAKNTEVLMTNLHNLITTDCGKCLFRYKTPLMTVFSCWKVVDCLFFHANLFSVDGDGGEKRLYMWMLFESAADDISIAVPAFKESFHSSVNEKMHSLHLITTDHLTVELEYDTKDDLQRLLNKLLI
jgi:hypothetical protein